MDVKIVGTGCAKCKKLEETVSEVIQEMAIEASVGKISDIKEIAETGIMMTPGLIIDGKVKLSGKLPSKEEVAKIIKSSI